MLPSESRLWALAVLTFGIGDVATTIAFLETGVAVGEGHPVVASAIDATGTWILIPWKAVAIAAFYVAARAVPDPHRLGVPIGLTLIGAFLTGWNLYGAWLGHNPVPIF